MPPRLTLVCVVVLACGLLAAAAGDVGPNFGDARDSIESFRHAAQAVKHMEQNELIPVGSTSRVASVEQPTGGKHNECSSTTLECVPRSTSEFVKKEQRIQAANEATMSHLTDALNDLKQARSVEGRLDGVVGTALSSGKVSSATVVKQAHTHSRTAEEHRLEGAIKQLAGKVSSEARHVRALEVRVKSAMAARATVTKSKTAATDGEASGSHHVKEGNKWWRHVEAESGAVRGALAAAAVALVLPLLAFLL